MIGYLAGKLLEKNANLIVIDVGGVGYEVTIPLSTFYTLGEPGEEVRLRIHTHVREDAIQLFGFSSVQERELFLKLVSVQGVGAKSGISMLSSMSADEFVAAIRSENLAKLTAISGVGKKTAERMVIELRDKVGNLGAGVGVQAAGSGSGSEDHYDDALSALLNLGYQRAAAEKALQQSAKEVTEPTVQKLLRNALQRLAK